MKFTLITVFALVGAAMAAPVIEERQATSSAAPSTYEARGAWGRAGGNGWKRDTTTASAVPSTYEARGAWGRAGGNGWKRDTTTASAAPSTYEARGAWGRAGGNGW